MKQIITFFLLLCFPPGAFAQQRELRGEMLDAADLSSLPHGVIMVKGDSSLQAVTDDNGHFGIRLGSTDTILIFHCDGYKTEEKIVSPPVTFVRVLMKADTIRSAPGKMTGFTGYRHQPGLDFDHLIAPVSVYRAETYDRVRENPFVPCAADSLSLFALSDDRASYSNIRRFINNKEPIPPEAVRVEEMVNYFPVHNPPPAPGAILGLRSELADCPWNPADRLLRITVQAKKILRDSLPPLNLVFLLDVSGSMSDADKLPLLKEALNVLIPQLGARDRVSIVLYNDSARLALPPTPGNRQEILLDMVNNLVADGTTAGEKGIVLAYKVATKNFIRGGVNRVILATDGDFNVGPSADEDMRKLILRKRQSGVYLTCIGFGRGNYKDSKLETLAKWGNGNFVYIDNQEEANKIFGEEFEGTLFTVARDAVMKVVFNPALVKAYRLTGYANRVFTGNDTAAVPMQGGQIGAGLGITALYEIIPQIGISPEEMGENTLAGISVQFMPAGDTVEWQIHQAVRGLRGSFNRMDKDFRFAGAVALFGMLLKDSRFTGNGSYKMVEAIAKKSIDKKTNEPYRREFLKLVKMVKRSNYAVNGQKVK